MGNTNAKWIAALYEFGVKIGNMVASVWHATIRRRRMRHKIAG